MRRKRNHHFKSGEKNEEYAAEISPAGIPIRHKRKEIANEIEGTNTGAQQDQHSSDIKKLKKNVKEIKSSNTRAMIGYGALFLSLFSIAFYPVTLGSLAILVGLLAVNFGARTLGYTAIGFGSFSVLFTLLYPLALSAF